MSESKRPDLAFLTFVLLLPFMAACRSEMDGPSSSNGVPSEAALVEGSAKQPLAFPKPNRQAKQSFLRKEEMPAPEAEEFVKPVPKGPALVQETRPSLMQARTELVAMKSAPFPYDGQALATNRPFLNVALGSRRGHRTWRGHVFWADETYSDNHVLLHIPKGFDVRKPGVIVLFFHGHGATLERDVRARQKLPNQVTAAGVNAVLVAPQLAFDAADSSIGKLGQPGGLDRFMAEAEAQLVKMTGEERAAPLFSKMPIVIVAYSGGYVAAASCLENNNVSNRVRGVVLMDALYGDEDKFRSWITKRKNGFFVSAFASSTRAHNLDLEAELKARELPVQKELPRRLRAGNITFISTPAGTEHRDFMTRAWTENPVQDVLTRLRADIG
jgi:hypothetical protein